jgi:hypothetical protein
MGRFPEAHLFGCAVPQMMSSWRNGSASGKGQRIKTAVAESFWLAFRTFSVRFLG